MTTPQPQVRKICTVCKTDVSQTKRVKDDAGKYYCHPCWAKRQKSSSPPQNPRGTGGKGDPALGHYELAALAEMDSKSSVIATLRTAPSSAMARCGKCGALCVPNLLRQERGLMVCDDCFETRYGDTPPGIQQDNKPKQQKSSPPQNPLGSLGNTDTTLRDHELAVLAELEDESLAAMKKSPATPRTPVSAPASRPQTSLPSRTANSAHSTAMAHCGTCGALCAPNLLRRDRGLMVCDDCFNNGQRVESQTGHGCRLENIAKVTVIDFGRSGVSEPVIFKPSSRLWRAAGNT